MRQGALHRLAAPRNLFAALVTSARMRGLLHGPGGNPVLAAAIRAGDAVGLVTLTLDGRVVWLPEAVSNPAAVPRRVDLTDLPMRDALSVVFRRTQAA